MRNIGHSQKQILGAAEKYFELLDDDNDGIIDSNNINIESIELEKLRVLFPIFEKIEKYNLSFSFK